MKRVGIITIILLMSISINAQLDLPVVDDFAYQELYKNEPKSLFWTDSFVSINNQFAFDDSLASVGQATFDGKNNNFYSNIDQGTIADKLTSKGLNLGGYSSVDIGFFYQYGGKGDFVGYNSSDKLVLQVLPPNGSWETIWSVYGDSVYHEYNHMTETSNTVSANHTNYQNILLTITNNEYLQDGSKIRFVNYSSNYMQGFVPTMQGAVDHWNLEWLRIDDSLPQSYINDIGFTKARLDLLNVYECLPWNHWEDAKNYLMDDSLYITYQNFDNDTWNISREFVIIDWYGGEPDFEFTGGTGDDILSGKTETYPRKIDYTFPENNMDSAVYEVRAYIITDTSSTKRYYRENDTISEFHRFYDYYMYSDFSVERGFSIAGRNSTGGGIQLEFYNYTLDYLTDISIYFNQGHDDVNEGQFDLYLYGDSKGLIKSYTLNKPSNRGWKRYNIDDTSIPATSRFYVRIQKKSDEPLNIGWDINNDISNNLIQTSECSDSTWTDTDLNGSPMIRAIFE